MLRHEDLFHVGIVVEDLQAGMAAYGDPLGLDWRECFYPTPDVLTPEGFHTMEVGAVYSRSGPVHYELLQQHPGGLWADLGLHHLGYFTDDLPGEIERLCAAGATREGVMHRDGSPVGAYLLLDRTRIELIPRSAADRLIGPAV
ncbi:VOC family protein [Nocardioides humi]|uniref:VOC family protein n=1 Tax=Nocardioides humi TaxID=449461 RepID=A0ABN2A3W8_9ACTN|nr:VOC family protein [Nocardioides humi]